MLPPAIEPEGMVGDGTEHIYASASTAGILDNSGRKNRSKERDYFHITPAANGQPARAKCVDCGTQVVFSHGTSVLRKHRNSASCKKKRAATEEAPNCPRYCLPFNFKFCNAAPFYSVVSNYHIYMIIISFQLWHLIQCNSELW